MRKFLLLFSLAATTAVFLTTGCTEDETPIINPTIEFTSDDPTGVRGDYPTTDFETSDLDGFSYIAVRAFAGTNDLQSLSVLEDGAVVPADRLYFRDLESNTEILPQTNILLIGYESGLLWEIGINPQDDYSTRTYTIRISDTEGNEASVSLNLTTFDAGTPIENTLTGVLLNQGGPAGTGGLDLDLGEGTGTAPGDVTADIRDWGIDLSQPNATNWRQQIGPINNTTVHYAGGLPGDFKFTDISTKEEIQNYFDNGTVLPNDGGTKSDKVQVGDFFVVKSADGSRYYFLEVAEVNVVTTDNSDNYKFNIKY